MVRRISLGMALWALLAACGDSTNTPDGSVPADTGAGSDAGVVVDTGSPPADPFAALPDESEGLVNVSADLNVLLENGALAGACAAFDLDPSDRQKRLLCGKSMFFYETFGTAGVPRALVEILLEHFEDEVGAGLSKQGLVPDPNATDGLPLGLAASKTIEGGIETVAYTCASCHFGVLPDGRYAVGAANYDFEYGKQILAIIGVPGLLNPAFDPDDHDPAFVAYMTPFKDKLDADGSLRSAILPKLIPLLGAPQAGLTKEQEGQYASWWPGTMDFMIAPLPVDDGVHTISKISPLWSIPRPEEEQAAGMPNAMLGWTGTSPSLMSFLEGFVTIGDGDLADWRETRLEPLADYIYSLRPPTPPPDDGTLIDRGEALFEEQGCLDCHAGPRGSGIEQYTYEEIGTDEAMKFWADPEGDGSFCCGLERPASALPNRLKSPRLVGLWTMDTFLHNGAVRSLEDLFCMNGARTSTAALGYSAAGHDYTCDNLSDPDKRALIAYLKSH